MWYTGYLFRPEATRACFVGGDSLDALDARASSKDAQRLGGWFMTGDTAVRVIVDDVMAHAAAVCRSLASDSEVHMSVDSEVHMTSVDSQAGGPIPARMCYRILGRSSVDIIKSGG